MSDDRVATNYFNEVGKKDQATAAKARVIFTELALARESVVKLKKRLRTNNTPELREAIDKVTRRIAALESKSAEGYVRFVIKEARRYTKDPQLLRDLIGEGNGGLMEAVKRFNVHYGFQFLTYAVYWIDVRIEEYLNSQGVVHVPNHARKAARKMRKEEEAEMALGVRSVYSAEEPVNAGVEADQIAAPSPEECNERVVLRHMLDAGLDLRSRLILINTYGFRATTPMDVDDLSDYFFALDGSMLTHESLKELREAASLRLRDHLASVGLHSSDAVI